MATIKDFVYTNKNSISIELCRDMINLFEKEKHSYPGVTAQGINKKVKDSFDFTLTDKYSNVWNEINNCLRTEVYKNLENYLIHKK